MSPDSTSDKKTSLEADQPLWLAFAAFSAISLVVASVILSLLIGFYTSPQAVGLFLILPYYTYTLSLGRWEMNDGNRWLEFSKNFWLFRIGRRHLQLQFLKPCKELVDAEMAPQAQFMITLFPHGTSADYRVLMDGVMNEVFPNVHCHIRTLAATVLFRLPLVREVALWTGCIDARRSVAEAALAKGRTVMVVPGGEAEQIRTTHGQEMVYLSRRQGFLKLAMRHNVPVVPAYVFGVSDYYYTSHLFFGCREWLRKRFGVCIPLAAGLWGSPACPLPVKTTIVFGKPLSFPMKDSGSPSQEEVDLAHETFCAELKKLFDEHKGEVGYRDRELSML